MFTKLAYNWIFMCGQESMVTDDCAVFMFDNFASVPFIIFHVVLVAISRSNEVHSLDPGDPPELGDLRGGGGNVQTI